MKKSQLKKLIKTVLVEAKPKVNKIQITILVETEEDFAYFSKELEKNLEDSYFYSDDFPGRVISAKTKRV
jgi:hypothetical protein